MITKEGVDLESLFFAYVDKFKFLFFPEEYSNVFLDYTKNEILAILVIYRKNTVNMTEIAEYIKAPLNTATGVINRLEKKQIVQRTRDSEDRRVVKISLTEKGKQDFDSAINMISHYLGKLYQELTVDERQVACSIGSKIYKVLNEQKKEDINQIPVKKVRRIIIE